MPVHLVVGRSLSCYICRSNTASILEYEILSHSIADRLPHDSVADPEVQKRRSAKKVPNGRDLHDYANLYFNGRNSMMYSITKSQGVDEICLLRVDVAVLDLPGTVVTDSNAASGHAKFSDPTTGLSLDRSKRGKGVALQFKKRFPDMFAEYARRCRDGEVRLGEPYLWAPLVPPWVLNFPTNRLVSCQSNRVVSDWGCAPNSNFYLSLTF